MRKAVVVGLLLAMALSTGCANSADKNQVVRGTFTDQKQSSGTQSQKRTALESRGKSEWAHLVDVPSVGRFFYVCQRSRGSLRFATNYVASSATQDVTRILPDGSRRTKTLQPGERWRTPLMPSGEAYKWVVRQATSPSTITVRTTIAFPNTSECIVPTARLMRKERSHSVDE